MFRADATTLSVTITGVFDIVIADGMRLQQVVGDGGLDDNFTVLGTSPTIDAGDPTSAFALEPSPNGGRVNQGSTGNTAQATKSASQFVQVTSPNGLEKLTVGASTNITWRDSGLGGTVTIELLQSGASVATITATAPNNGSFAWTPPNLPGSNYQIRITANSAAAAVGVSESPFLIVPAGHDYYVNDNSTVGDTLTTAVGDDANSGKTPDQPMNSLAAVLQAYHLSLGDIVHIDNGTYPLYRNLVITTDDSGVRIDGPALGTATLNRGFINDSVFTYAIDLQGADDVTLNRLTITGATGGVHTAFNMHSDRLTVSNCDISGNGRTGIDIENLNDDAHLLNNIVHNNQDGQGSAFNIQAYGDRGLVYRQHGVRLHYRHRRQRQQLGGQSDPRQRKHRPQ